MLGYRAETSEPHSSDSVVSHGQLRLEPQAVNGGGVEFFRCALPLTARMIPFQVFLGMTAKDQIHCKSTQ